MNWEKNYVLLETLRRDQDNTQNFFFANPLDTITCSSPSGIQKCFRKMESYRQEGYFLAGFFSYELGYFLEDTLNQYCPKTNYPLLWFGVYQEPCNPKACFLENRGTNYTFSSPVLAEKYSSYKRNIAKIKTCLAQGETYQINYTSRYNFNFIGNIFDFYNQLKHHQKVSYSALINYHGNSIISLSPELFFRIDKNRNIKVKPMKGTAPIGTPPGWLQKDIKNTSENVMIVDLLRNDLGRICKSGTVRVRELFGVETYETLLQMTSTVTGKLQSQISILDLMKSLFPCGSVTGAPKISSMKIIRDLETEPRNIYTGAIGYFAPDGQAAFNVAIRTIDLQARRDQTYSAQMGVGGGIVFDSQPQEEYAECQLKAKFLFGAMPHFALIETMLFTEGKIQYLSRHLQRLKASAGYFTIPCPIGKIQNALKEYSTRLTGKIRLRLLLKSNSEIVLEHQPLPAIKPAMPLIALSGFQTRSDDPFLYHKSTHRKQYDEEYKRYVSEGYFDVIFRNEKDQITEGAISNIFVRIKDRYFTPPISCGLLPGIGRQIMIKKLKAREKIMYLKDLKTADKILLTNSVRGATEVTLDGNLSLCN
ncbi:MAG: aminodeoxychorismate synthase component I [Smithellaceae bacterium]|nr:aminodeoxychorismate synthase component I [Smithellaceae bacterium]